MLLKHNNVGQPLSNKLNEYNFRFPNNLKLQSRRQLQKPEKQDSHLSKMITLNKFTRYYPDITSAKRPLKYLLAILCRFLNILLIKNLKQNHIIVLNYHSVSPNDHPEGAAVSPENLSRQIEIITKEYNVIHIDEAMDLLATKNDFLSAIIVTFDDGFKDNYEYAFPILKKHECPAVIFLATAFVNKEIKLIDDVNFHSLSWDDTAEMESTGLVKFASHSHNHEKLSHLSRSELQSDLRQSKTLLTEKLNTTLPYFAYPNGQSKDFNEDTVEILKSENFAGAFSTLWGVNTSNTNKFALKRIRIDGSDSETEFRMKIRGDYDYIGLIHKIKKYIP